MHQLALNSTEPLQNTFKNVHQKYWLCMLNFLYVFPLIIIFQAIPTIISALMTAAGIKIGSISKILLNIPAIIFSTSIIFDEPLILFENNTPWAAVKAGIKLIWGKFWRTALGIYLPTFILYGIIMILILLTVFSHSLFLLFTIGTISLAVMILVSLPLYISLILVQFNDLKLRQQVATPVTPAAPTITPVIKQTATPVVSPTTPVDPTTNPSDPQQNA
jgi:hypothetical protein